MGVVGPLAEIAPASLGGRGEVVMDSRIATQAGGVVAEVPLRAFAVVVRGYDRLQVDEHLQQVDAEMRQHREQVQALQQELNEARRQLREQERPAYAGVSSRIERLLQLAEERAVEIVAESRSAANELQAAAKVDAAELRAAAEREVAKLRAMADHEVAEKRTAVERDMAELRTTTEREVAQLKASAKRERDEILSTAKRQADEMRTQAQRILEESEGRRAQTEAEIQLASRQPPSAAPARGPVRPTLNTARPRSTMPAVPVVGERVSTAVDMFRDRVALRTQLRGLILAREKPIICITGPRGIGKSGLVATVLADFEEAADMAEDSVGGLAYLSTRTGAGVLDLARVFHALTRLLPPDQGDRLEEEWANAGADALPDLLTALRARNAVLLLDNLDDVQDPEFGELTHEGLITFLTAVCREPKPPIVITTSQYPVRLPAETEEHSTILEIDDGLEADEAIELLRQFDADNRAGLRDLPDAELLAGVELVYREPRGLELLFALIERGRVDALRRLSRDRDTPEVLLERLVSTGFQSLDEVERDVVRVLALADTPLPADAIPAMLEDRHPADEVARVIERLAETHMIGFECNTGRARLHPIDSDYVYGTLLADRGKRDALDLRLADWLASQRADPVTWRTSSDVDPQRREIRHRLRAGDAHGAVHVIADIAEFLGRHGEGDQLTDVLEGLRFADTPAERAEYELSRGAIAYIAGSLDDAIGTFRAGRDAAKEAGNRTLTARLDSFLGVALRHAGNAEAALEPLERASELPVTDKASRSIVVYAVFQRGLSACSLGAVAEAEESAARIETMLQEDDPALWWAELADLRTVIALLRGDHADALAEAEKSIACYANSHDQGAIGYLMNIRGMVLLAQERTREAADEFTAVRENAGAVRYPRLEGIAALNLAWTQLSEGDRQAAAATARDAADLLSANGVREAESAQALAAACEAGEGGVMLQRLRLALTASHGNLDLYQPSDEFLTVLAAGLA